MNVKLKTAIRNILQSFQFNPAIFLAASGSFRIVSLNGVDARQLLQFIKKLFQLILVVHI